MKNNTFNEIIKPVIVLVAICLVITGLLAYVNTITSPIITKAEAEKAQTAMSEVLPQAESFDKVDVKNMPESITEVYKDVNNTGYVFMLTTKGYGGDMKLICGVNSDGTISSCKTLSHAETSGLGSKTAEDPYRNQYVGKSADTLSQVDAISGATISSNAYMGAIEDAMEAFKAIKEEE